MEIDKNTEKTLELLHKYLKGTHTYQGWYSIPYSDANDDSVDYIIEYKIKKISLWRGNSSDECVFEGTIYIEPIKLSLGVNGEWEHNFKQHDIYEGDWEECGEDLIEKINKFFNHICLDYDFDFKKLN